MIDEHPCQLRYVPLGRSRSSIRRDILSMAWAIRSRDELMLLISPSTMLTLVKRLDGSSSLVVVRKFAETLIPIDAGSGEDE